MAKKKAFEPLDGEAAEAKQELPSEAPKEAQPKSVAGHSVQVFVPKNLLKGVSRDYTRTFSKEAHGEDFRDHAARLAEAEGGKIVE